MTVTVSTISQRVGEPIDATTNPSDTTVTAWINEFVALWDNQGWGSKSVTIEQDENPHTYYSLYNDPYDLIELDYGNVYGYVLIPVIKPLTSITTLERNEGTIKTPNWVTLIEFDDYKIDKVFDRQYGKEYITKILILDKIPTTYTPRKYRITGNWGYDLPTELEDEWVTLNVMKRYFMVKLHTLDITGEALGIQGNPIDISASSYRNSLQFVEKELQDIESRLPKPIIYT